MKSLQDYEMSNDEHAHFDPECPFSSELPESLNRFPKYESGGQNNVHPFDEYVVTKPSGHGAEISSSKSPNNQKRREDVEPLSFRCRKREALRAHFPRAKTNECEKKD
jgi:hypothetical protein